MKCETTADPFGEAARSALCNRTCAGAAVTPAADAKCPREVMPGNLKSSGLLGKGRRDSGRAGAEQHRLARLGLSAGGGVVCCIAAVPGRNFG